MSNNNLCIHLYLYILFIGQINVIIQFSFIARLSDINNKLGCSNLSGFFILQILNYKINYFFFYRFYVY